MVKTQAHIKREIEAFEEGITYVDEKNVKLGWVDESNLFMTLNTRMKYKFFVIKSVHNPTPHPMVLLLITWVLH
jgi:hypothetical protein